MIETAKKIAADIQRRKSVRPDIGLVLGSGWGKAAEGLVGKCAVPYKELEGMPQCGVAGHAGNFLFGELSGRRVAVVQGRFHLYEGRRMEEVLLPVRILYEMGVRDILLTNAAGGVNTEYEAGDLMVLNDHINFTGRNPLVGVRPTDAFPVFVDMTKVYDGVHGETIAREGGKIGIKVHRGVYIQVLGPSYETPAEVRAFRYMGADAVGMSTAIEAVYAHYLGMRVTAVSCITNKAAGNGDAEISHKEVLDMAKLQEKRLGRLISNILRDW